MIVIFVFSTIATVVMGYYKFYFSEVETSREEILTYMAQDEAYHIANNLEYNKNLQRYYKDKNVYYRIM